MSYSTSSEEDERDQVIMPNAIVAQAKEAIEKMVPPKSRLLYEKEYKLFCEWRKNQKAKGVDENIILAYVLERSRSVKSSSLWSYFSQLKKMLLVKENIDTGRFHQVKTFLKQQCIGHRPKKSKVFTRGIASVALQQLYSLTQVPICSYLRNMEDGVPVWLLKILSRIKSPYRNKFSVELKKKKHLKTSLSLQPQRIKQTQKKARIL
jgi:hypothetical protein